MEKVNQGERLSDKLEVFLTEEYYFSMRMMGRKCQIIIKSGIMKFHDGGDIEYSQTKCDDIDMLVFLTGKYKFILDVITVKGVDISYLTLEKRLIMAEDFLRYNDDFDIVDLLTQDEMMEIYFDDQIDDFVSIHKQTGKRGIIGVNDIESYLYYIRRIEDEENRLEDLERQKKIKIEEAKEDTSLSESSQIKKIERIEQTYELFSQPLGQNYELMKHEPEKFIKETVVTQELIELYENYWKIADTEFRPKGGDKENDRIQSYQEVIELEVEKRDKILKCQLMRQSIMVRENILDQGGGQPEKKSVTKRKKNNFKKKKK